MNRLHSIKLIALAAMNACALLTTASYASAQDASRYSVVLVPFPFTASYASAQDASPAQGPQRVLRVGESLHYDSGLKVTFLAVRNDSRCPINAQCVWAGDAEVVLRVKAGNQAARIVRIHTELEPREAVIPANVFPPGMAGIPKSYVIGIARLNPVPTAGRKTLQSEYRSKLAISVAQ